MTYQRPPAPPHAEATLRSAWGDLLANYPSDAIRSMVNTLEAARRIPEPYRREHRAYEHGPTGWARRLEPYRPWIDEAARRFDVPPVVIRAVILQESGGDAKTQTKGTSAKGLMQTIDATFALAREALAGDGLQVENPLTPRDSILAGAWYLAYCFDLAARDHGITAGRKTPARGVAPWSTTTPGRAGAETPAPSSTSTARASVSASTRAATPAACSPTWRRWRRGRCPPTHEASSSPARGRACLAGASHAPRAACPPTSAAPVGPPASRRAPVSRRHPQLRLSSPRIVQGNGDTRMNNPDTEPRNARFGFRTLARGWKRAACLLPAVLACAFAGSGQAQPLYEKGLDEAVSELARTLVIEADLENEKVLVKSDDFFEMETDLRLGLSEMLKGLIVSELTRSGVLVSMPGSDEDAVRVLHGRWRRESETVLYLELFVAAPVEGGDPTALKSAKGRMPIDESIKKAIESTPGDWGRLLVLRLEGGA